MGSPRPRAVVLDAGALIQFDRGHARMRALVRLALERSAQVIVPAGVLGQAWRDGSRQVPLAALLSARITLVESLDEPMAKAAGVLCGRSRTADVIDASVVLAARSRDAVVVTTDESDLRRIDPGLDVESV
jgi:rRNA-processing protein FCF1